MLQCKSLYLNFSTVIWSKNMYELYLDNSLSPNQLRHCSTENQPLSLLISSPLKIPCLLLSFSLPIPSLLSLSPLTSHFFFFFNSLTQNAAISSISATAIQAFAIQVQSTSYSSQLQSKIRKIHLHPQNQEQSHIFVACISYCIYLS